MKESAVYLNLNLQKEIKEDYSKPGEMQDRSIDCPISNSLLTDNFLIKKIISIFNEEIEQIQKELQYNQNALIKFNLFTNFYIRLCLNYPHILKLTYFFQQQGFNLEQYNYYWLEEFLDLVKRNNIILSEIILQGQIEGCFDPHFDIHLLVNSFFFTLNLLLKQHILSEFKSKDGNFTLLIQDYLKSIKSIILTEEEEFLKAVNQIV